MDRGVKERLYIQKLEIILPKNEQFKQMSIELGQISDLNNSTFRKFLNSVSGIQLLNLIIETVSDKPLLEDIG
jgi:hypothetical protein